MFDRAGLKTAAKARVSQNRWMAVLVCLVASFCGVIGNSSASFGTSFSNGFENGFNSGSADTPSFGSGIESLLSDTDLLIFLAIILIVFAVVTLAVVAFGVFVSNVISVGFHGWFLRFSRGENPDFGEMFSGFNHYKHTMLGMLLRGVYIFLWSLLLIIPGIIKAYSYAMVPFILYENPSMSAKEALSISEAMMDGWKWELFKFELSFFGWHIANMFTCGLLALLFINPYMFTSFAMLYDNIKYDAVYTRGVVNASTLNMPLFPYQPETEVVE